MRKTHLTTEVAQPLVVDDIVLMVVTELLLPLLSNFGFIILSLLEEERLPETVCTSLTISISNKQRLI